MNEYRPPSAGTELTSPEAAVAPRNWLVAGAILLLVAVAARAQTFGNPVLGFDEQFYLVVGDRMLHGAVPFVDIFDRKPIGLFLIYAFIRLLGGEGTIQYQMVALLFAWATALFIWRFGRRMAGPVGAIAAGIAYLLWLDFLEGEAGQAPVFFNLPVVIAATIVERLVTGRQVTLKSGLAPMLLVGIAIQIKYTALFEGLFFGCALLIAAWRQRAPSMTIAGMAICWIAAALASTIAAYLVYAAMGDGQAFLFANFISMWGKLPDPFDTSAVGLLTILGVLLPFLMCVAFPPTITDEQRRAAFNFVRYWLIAATLGMIAMRSFSTPQYAMPVAVPAIIAASPRLGAMRPDRRLVWLVLLIAFGVSQFVLRSLQDLKGGAREAAMMTRAATPPKGCLFVYDGYPALYRLTHSCLLSRFVFPGHLNMSNENSAQALGVSPASEVRRILAEKPNTIVVDDPPFERVNQETYAIVQRELAQHYVRVFAMRTGDRQRLVYRRKD